MPLPASHPLVPAGDTTALRVLWITTRADVDGPGRVLSALLSHWPAGDALAVCALDSASDEFRGAVPSSLPIFELRMSRLFDARVFARLRRVCRVWQPNLLHTHLSRADWIGRAAGRALGIPVVSALQNLHSRMYASEFRPAAARVGHWLDRVTLPWANRVIAVSAGVGSDFAAHHPGRTGIVVLNGLDFRRVETMRPRALIRADWNVSEADVVVGTVARCTPQKGLRSFVDAARLVSGKSPNVHFVHIGAGPLLDEIQQKVMNTGLGPRFKFLGQLSDPMTVLSGLDLFVLPSLWEGLPIALLEAMAAGVAPIGTDVPGINDVIEHNRSGLLVPIDDPEALAGAIGSLVTDAARRRALAGGAAERVRAFDAAKAAPAYRRVLADAATGDRR